jgi:homoserine O-acetyltransferase
VPTPSPTPRNANHGRDVHAVIPADFRLESGERLLAGRVQGRLHGPDNGPLVAVSGGISSGRFPSLDAAGQPGWWPWVVSRGGPVDLETTRVLAFDFLPGDGEELVTITATDQARLLALLLDGIGEPRLDAFVGASYGGVVALAFAATLPDRIGRLVVISAAHRTHPMATAWRGLQRRILSFARKAGQEAEGIALARELAMTSYRTPEEFGLRFASTAPAAAGEAYPVCEYLTARGAAYSRTMGVDRWISLSDSLDRHDLAPERILAPLTLVGFTSDRLVPIDDLRDLAARVPTLERFIEAPSIFGHDAFLKERELISRALTDALLPLFARAREIAA